MREVKFRGKVDGVWWYVSPDHNPNLFGQFWHVVDRETVGEYSGITDKQNKELYEGDIVRYTIPGNYELPPITRNVCIEWEENIAGFVLGCTSHRLTIQKDVEVIGNIYDTPELLK